MYRSSNKAGRTKAMNGAAFGCAGVCHFFALAL
jgi:hypothetical protein